MGKDQSVIWEKKDPHSRAHAVLSTTRSLRMGEALQIEHPAKSARCNVCHSPMKTVAPERLIKEMISDNGVSCETCHGAAEPWLQFHTRKDVTHAQRVAAGLRELTDLYSRANACVSCHLNIDPALVSVGHPQMFFELDGQMNAQPPHYKDEGAGIGPRAWLTGQAVALRELSWKLANQKDEQLVPRWRALVWLINKTDLGSGSLSANTDFATTQAAADRLAKRAARDSWSNPQTAKLLGVYTALSGEFRDTKEETVATLRKAEVLVLALDRLWVAMKKDTGAKSENFDTALVTLTELAREQRAFDRVKFAAALEQLEVALLRQ